MDSGAADVGRMRRPNAKQDATRKQTYASGTIPTAPAVTNKTRTLKNVLCADGRNAINTADMMAYAAANQRK